jgi:uncharacterized Fe-S cluster protein YjdI
MKEKEIREEFSNADITIVWKPKKCIHAAVCVQTLPEVYKPNSRSWISIENAKTEDLKSQISKCPSGALSYYTPNNEKGIYEEESKTEIEVMQKGPLLVKGAIKLLTTDGNSEMKTGNTAFCRCGASENKPFCDGMHLKINFKG